MNIRKGWITWRARALLLTIVGLLSCALGPASAQQGGRATIRVAMPTVVFQTLAAYYTSLPLELYWKEENLDVQVIGLAGANAAAQALDAGQADVAILSNSALFSLLDKFPDSGVTAFYTFITGFQSMPAVTRDSPLKTVRELEGKTVGVQSLGNSQVQVLKALVQQAGGAGESLKLVPVGEGIEAAHAISTKRVDALGLLDGLYAQIEAEGIPLRELTSEAISSETVGFIGSIITKNSYLQSNRDTLVRFARAIAKGTVFNKTNPEATVRIHWKVYPATRQRGIPEQEAMRRSLMPLKARLANVGEVDGLYGNSTRTQIEGYMNLFVIGGVIKGMIPVESFWNPTLLGDINRFDRAVVEKQAREWRG